MRRVHAAVRRDLLGPWSGLATFYAASFAVLAVYMQFFPLWLQDARGLTAEQVAVVLAAQTIARTVAGPLWAARVDRGASPRSLLRWLALASCAAFLVFGAVRTPVALWLVSFAFGCLYPPMHPILDALALQRSHSDGFAYGRLRLVGSLSYLIVILLVGWWLEATSVAGVFPLLVVGLTGTLAAAFVLPAAPPLPVAPVAAPSVPGAAPAGSALRRLLRPGPFLLLLIASASIQGSHATYYNLSTLHWRRHGIEEATAGVLWAEGILAEIVLFFVARGTVERLRPTTLLLLGGVAAALRWVVIGATTSVPVLLLTNWLHAASFTATYLGSLRALERRVAPHERATAQGLLGAATSGVGMVVCGLLGGWAYERAAGFAFFLMAAFALLGAGLAFVLRRNADRAPTEVIANTTSSAR
jgi:PPP family 3-phenylpropionic acid transporter